MARLEFSHERIKASESIMESVSDFVEIQQSLSIITGRDSDNRVLECAVEGKADYIVTGDKKHLLPHGTFQGIQIVSPRDFLTVINVSDR
jgi:predicted nucleic acid-binding protein